MSKRKGSTCKADGDNVAKSLERHRSRVSRFDEDIEKAIRFSLEEGFCSSLLAGALNEVVDEVASSSSSSLTSSAYKNTCDQRSSSSSFLPDARSNVNGEFSSSSLAEHEIFDRDKVNSVLSGIGYVNED